MFIHSIILVILVAITQGAPIEITDEIQPEIFTPIPILSQTEDNLPDGSFSYR